MSASKLANQPKYKDASLPVEVRVKDLLGRMTLEEKFRQMNMSSVQGKIVVKGEYDEERARQFLGDIGIGAIQDLRKDPEVCAEAVNQIQDYLVNRTRLGIPAFVIAESLHGVMSPKTTVFPQAIGLGSTWNPELIREVAEASAKEATLMGINQVLAPNLDLARDPRWGRVEETYGEDPYLASRLDVAYVQGLQGDTGYLDGEHVVATAKHYGAPGAPEGGVNIAPVSIGDRQLREVYLEPFRAVIEEAHALSVMPGYNELDGVPVSIHRPLLDDILRGELGFEGYTISDFGALDMLIDVHRVVRTMTEVGRLTLEAGMDMEAPSISAYSQELQQLVREGIVSEELVDRAVERILTVKFRAGLFERQAADVKQTLSVVNSASHKALARRTAEESVVLLKNDDVLPLQKGLSSIAVIGPNAAVAQLGNYSYHKEETITPLMGLKEKLAGSSTELCFAQGCGLTEQTTDGFAEAVDAARSSEVAIVFVGGTSAVKGGIGWGSQEKTIATCGEGYDRHSLELPGVQQKLVEAVVATGTPTVVVLISGRPQTIPWIAEHVPAIVQAWYPGEEGGRAIADILFGDVNPSGKLNVSFPKDVGQVPVYYKYKPSARGFYFEPGSPEAPGRDYVFLDTKPLYRFGHGLSYTTFEYSELKLERSRIRPYERVKVSVKVTNHGERAGKEVVQLYVDDIFSTVTTPVEALRGFKKLWLESGETKQVEFELGPQDFELLDISMKRAVEPGDFEIKIGPLVTTLTIE